MDGWNGMEWNGMGWDGWKENHISSTYFFFNYHDHFPFPHLSIYLSTPSYYTLPYPTLVHTLPYPTLPYPSTYPTLPYPTLVHTLPLSADPSHLS